MLGKQGEREEGGGEESEGGKEGGRRREGEREGLGLEIVLVIRKILLPAVPAARAAGSEGWREGSVGVRRGPVQGQVKGIKGS